MNSPLPLPLPRALYTPPLIHYIITGPQSSGKTTLATYIHSLTKCKIIDTLTVITESEELMERMYKGEAINDHDEDLVKEMQDIISSDEVMCKGCILDTAALPPQLSGDKTVHIITKISLEDINYRLETSMFDPQTKAVYLRDQIEELENAPHDEFTDEIPDVEGDAEEEELDGNDKANALSSAAKNKKLTPDIMRRLIKNPEQPHETIREAKVPFPCDICVELNAIQKIPEMYEHLKESLDNHGVLPYATPVDAYELKEDPSEDQPQLYPSHWGEHDPVEYFRTRTLVKGSEKAVYQSLTYFLLPTNLEFFLASPRQFIKIPQKVEQNVYIIYPDATTEVQAFVEQLRSWNANVFNCVGKIQTVQGLVAQHGAPSCVIALNYDKTLEDISKKKTEEEDTTLDTMQHMIKTVVFFEKSNTRILRFERIQGDTLNIVAQNMNPFLPTVADLPEDSELTSGWCAQYCPYSLKKHNILKLGNPSLRVSYDYRAFSLTDAQAKEQVLMDPYSYLAFPQNTPPVRLAIVGSLGSGKSTILKSLPNIPVVNWSQCYSEGANIETVLEGVFASQKNGFILQGFPANKQDATSLTKSIYSFDALIAVKAPTENCVDRMISKSNFKASISHMDSGAKEDALTDETSRLNDLISRESSEVEDVIEVIRDSNIMQVFEIDNTRTQRQLLAVFGGYTHDLIENRENLFKSAVSLEISKAAYLSSNNIIGPGILRNLCPVKLHHSQGILRECIGALPVRYDDRLYLLNSQDAVHEFTRSPLKYIAMNSIPSSVTQPRISVLGQPKSGKSSLTTYLQQTLGPVIVTSSSALQFCSSRANSSMVASAIMESLCRGSNVSDEQLVEAVRLMLSCKECAIKGYILEDFPSSVNQAMLLEKANILPQRIFRLAISNITSEKRAHSVYQEVIRAGDYGSLETHNLPRLRQEFETGTQAAIDYYDSVYNLVEYIDGERSRWFIHQAVSFATRQNIARRQRYAMRSQDAPAAVGIIGIPLETILQNKSSYDMYSPVRLKMHDELVPVAIKTHWACEYKSKYYFLLSEAEQDDFMKNPISEANPKTAIANLPVSKPSSSTSESCELKGYCPVTLLEGQQSYESVVLGDPQYSASYKGKTFCFRNSAQHDKFMRSPWKYSDQALPTKLPPVKLTGAEADIPIRDYLDATTTQAVNRAIQRLSSVKPKYPFKSAKTSALEYLALALKADNRDVEEQVRNDFRMRLQKYEETCNMTKDLALKMKSINQPEEFSPVESEKLEEFLKLRDLSIATGS